MHLIPGLPFSLLFLWQRLMAVIGEECGNALEDTQRVSLEDTWITNLMKPSQSAI